MTQHRFIAAFTLLLLPSLSFEQEFLRPLPEKIFSDALTSEKYRNADAVVILKEQSYNTSPTSITYQGHLLNDVWSSTYTKILIVKLFNAAAVEKYGSFEYFFREYYQESQYADLFACGFEAKARVLKPDGKVEVMDGDEVKILIHRKNSLGTPLEREALFKVPNLAAGDILQIEYTLTRPFSAYSSDIFYYSEHDPVLFSNLSITLPKDARPEFVSLPEERVGKPKAEQVSKNFGAGESFFWSVKNLAAIPDEAFSLPFEDQSLLTAFFYVHRAPSGRKNKPSWELLAKHFCEDDLSNDKVSTSRIKELGFSSNEDSITIGKVDALYTALRKMIVLDSYNWLYPLSHDIDYIFKQRHGDASDVAYIMYNILQQWDQNVRAVWIRDNRDGTYERSVPSEKWFDRLGVLVTVNGQEKLYDFDRSIPSSYEEPWYLDNTTIAIITKDSCTHRIIQKAHHANDNLMSEQHVFTFGKNNLLRDSIVLDYKGSWSQQLRSSWYSDDEKEIKNSLRSRAKAYCLKDVDTLWHNDFLHEQEVELTFVGASQASADELDALLALRPKNHVLHSLHEKLFSTHRIGHIIFDGPFTVSMTWSIPLPKGFTLQSVPEDVQQQGVAGIISQVSYLTSNDHIDVSAIMNVPQAEIERKNYEDLLKAIDQVTNAVEREILLKKQ